jgi:hypothetical protein
MLAHKFTVMYNCEQDYDYEQEHGTRLRQGYGVARLALLARRKN